MIHKLMIDYVRGVILIYRDNKIVGDDFSSLEELMKKIEKFNLEAEMNPKETNNETNC